MKLPFNRERMQPNLLDDISEIELTAAQSPAERFAATLTLSDLALAFFVETRMHRSWTDLRIWKRKPGSGPRH